MSSYYNEIDPFAAQWLRNLIDAGHIAPGIVDERSIEDIHPEELDGFTQVHFFAGIGGWSLALRRAGWPDDEPVWTGSCPCQPFSSAGKGAGFADERHLWPAFHHLIAERRPPVVFGEQVAGGAGRSWLSLVRADLEALGYAVGAGDICAASLGAPHIRQRLFWVGDTPGERPGGGPQDGPRLPAEVPGPGCEAAGQLAHASALRHDGRRPGEAGHGRGAARVEPQRLRDAGGVGNAEGERHGAGALRVEDGAKRAAAAGGADEGLRLPGVADPSIPRDPGPTNGHWRDADWLPCRDGKARPVEPGTFPLAHGIPARVGRLRAYGNAIVPQVAQAFVEAYLQARVTA